MHDGAVEPLYGVGEGVEVARQEEVGGEVLLDDVEELHEPRGDVLGLAEVRGEGQPPPEGAQQAARAVGRRVAAAGGCVAHAHVAGGDGVEHGLVELVEVADIVDEHGALEGRLGGQVVAHDVVGEVVEDLHGEEEAGRRHAHVPVEDGLVDDLDLGGVAPRGGVGHHLRVLQGGQRRGDLDDLVLRPVVHGRLHVPDVVQYVQHQGAPAGAHLVDDEVVVRVDALHDVVGHEVLGDGLAVVGAEQLRRRVPELARVVVRLGVEGVLELGIPLSHLGVEARLVPYGVEVERFPGAEDDDLLGEVAVVRVIQAV